MVKHLPHSLASLLVSLSPKQSLVARSTARFRVVVAGRRFGKTYLALVEMLKDALAGPNRLIWYVGPNDRQSKRIVWDRLKAFTQPHWAKRPTESDRCIHFTNGSTIVVNGAFHPDSLRGVGLDFVVLDEIASIKPEAWGEVFRPALSDREGRALFIGTPKGRNHLYEYFSYAQNNPDWEAFQFTTAEGSLVTNAELLGAARELDPDTYRQEFAAEFVRVGSHLVYYFFDRTIHLRTTGFDPTYPLIWALDFNVNPMSMLLIQNTGAAVYVIDEIILREGNTEAACQALLDRVKPFLKDANYRKWPLPIEIYGDASGYQKRTSASATDWTIIRHFFEGHKGDYEISIRATSSNPPVRDRVNCVNRQFKNQTGDARLFVDPRCRELIKDLEQVVWQTAANGAITSEIDKSDHARTHTSDALGYYLAQAFPLKPLIGEQTRRLL